KTLVGETRDVTLVGATGIGDAYAKALTQTGYGVTKVDGGKAVVAGLWRIAARAGLTKVDR
ncbi:MAG: 2-dehydro-3-deoxygalactonokinase, partial [Alphaproteobacteria bacterium]